MQDVTEFPWAHVAITGASSGLGRALALASAVPELMARGSRAVPAKDVSAA
jgi:NAD(P)-dependent dehydrogenase (short-subunit alcohol dehydrogenase family)